MPQSAPNKLKHYDIIVAGGGMVGWTLSVMLAKEIPSISILIVDPATIKGEQKIEAAQNNSFDSRSTALSSGSVDLFKALAIWPLLEDFATPIVTVDVSDKGHLGRNAFTSSVKHSDTSIDTALGYVVENRAIGQALQTLANTLSNITFMPDSMVTEFTPNQIGACVCINKNKKDKQRNSVVHVDTQCLVIADGAQSELRKKLNIDHLHKSYKQFAVIANIKHELSHNGVAYERFTPEGPMAFLPRGNRIGANESALVWTRPVDKIQESLALNDDDFLAQIQKRFGFRLGKLCQVGLRDHYELNLILADEQVRSSLVIIGNAAHFLHPVAGQGFNLAARDCAQLVSVLASAHSQEKALGELSVLKNYIQKQRADQFSTVNLSHQFNTLFASKSKVMQLTRTLGLSALQHFAPVQKQFFNRMMGRAHSRPKLEFVRQYSEQQSGLVFKQNTDNSRDRF